MVCDFFDVRLENNIWIARCTLACSDPALVPLATRHACAEINSACAGENGKLGVNGEVGPPGPAGKDGM
jgi:hypothetical protein